MDDTELLKKVSGQLESLERKFDRFVVGISDDGPTDGLMPRMTRNEDKVSWMPWLCIVISSFVSSIVYLIWSWVLPGDWHRSG